MSLCSALSGRALCGASASCSGSPEWSTSAGCSRVPNAAAGGQQQQQQQQRGHVMICSISGFQVANFALGHAGAGAGGGGWRQQICAGSSRDCIDGCAGEKLPKIRATLRVHCQVGGGGRNLTVEDWTKKLPAKRKALYSHSLPCIEAWLQNLGFVQGKDDRAVWTIERPDWHAQLSLDVTDLYIRYLKKGPGNLERDIERKFSYALSREDLENAILGGP